MRVEWRSLLGGIALASFAAASAKAAATLTFCNDFPHAVFIAVAYPQDSGSWLSRGWLELHTGDCRPFDSAIRVTSFYFRSISENYSAGGGKTALTTWGDNGRTFATSDKDSFQYYGAENRVLKSSMRGYEKGIDIPAKEYEITVTFEADGTSREAGRTVSR